MGCNTSKAEKLQNQNAIEAIKMASFNTLDQKIVHYSVSKLNFFHFYYL